MGIKICVCVARVIVLPTVRTCTFESIMNMNSFGDCLCCEIYIYLIAQLSCLAI